jgi:hypothetical protein
MEDFFRILTRRLMAQLYQLLSIAGRRYAGDKKVE